ncbi:MAG: hypothetical protein D3906_08400, partial [Candidatus Electrothrix sp. AUS1_2]|nr:hypothetical protein [Candidatus Electrothrix sp. AUS1_2]
MSHHNWFLTLVEKNIIPVVWLSLLVSVGLTVVTYFIKPIYSVETELCLDSSIDKILPDLNGTPSINASDYIRQEYFAIHSVNLMQQPEIGQQVIHSQGLTDKDGNKLSVNDFINPSVFSLLFFTNGQGVTVKWISDTQQFSITGYGKDLDSASLLSSAYTDAFLSYDKRQYKSTLENLKTRQNIIQNSAVAERLAVENKQTALREKYRVADWEERLTSLTNSLASTERDIYAEEQADATAKQRQKEIEIQISELKKTIHLSETEKKSDPLASLQNRLTELNQELAAAAIELTPAHPEYKKIQSRIDSVIKQMTEGKKREYSQSIRSTSGALDNVLQKLMQIREEQAVRTTTLTELIALKEHYINELKLIGEGYALYNTLQERKNGLTNIIKDAGRNIIEIESVIQQPFSFFRVVSKPFIDHDNINDFKYVPQRKIMFILLFLGIFFLSFFYILIREVHIETLFYAWQLREGVDGIESFDIVSNRKIYFSFAHHIFHSSENAGYLLRIRKLDDRSDPDTIAKFAAEYFSQSSESTLLVNNHRKQPDCHEGKGLYSWLTGHLQEATEGIRKNSMGYNILCDAYRTPDEPWIKGRKEIKNLFSNLLEYYSNIILVDPALSNNMPSAGDFLTPDINILTVNGGALPIAQV